VVTITNPDHAPREGLSRRRRRPRMSEINVTPLVDVMLVLLIVFMVTAPLLTVGVSVDLPKTQASPLPGQDEPLTVSINRQGKVFLQETEVGVDALGPRLMAVSERNPDARIFVRGDKGIDYGSVMAVMGAIYSAGFSKVALITEFEERAPGLPAGRPSG
jgi:biopolymer transport protein TolR